MCLIFLSNEHQFRGDTAVSNDQNSSGGGQTFLERFDRFCVSDRDNKRIFLIDQLETKILHEKFLDLGFFYFGPSAGANAELFVAKLTLIRTKNDLGNGKRFCFLFFPKKVELFLQRQVDRRFCLKSLNSRIFRQEN